MSGIDDPIRGILLLEKERARGENRNVQQHLKPYVNNDYKLTESGCAYSLVLTSPRTTKHRPSSKYVVEIYFGSVSCRCLELNVLLNSS